MARVMIVRLVALSAGVVVLLTLARPLHALATSPTDTPVPTSTPYPTYTPAATQTPYPTSTAVPLPTLVPTATAVPLRGALQLSSSTGMGGSSLIASASNFSPHADLTLYWDGALFVHGTTDGAGFTRLDFHVPHDAMQGPHEVRVYGPQQEEATALYQVAQTYRPALTLSAPQVAQGKTLSVSASGVEPGQLVTFYLDRITTADALGSADADASGNAGRDVTIDAGTALGTHRLIAAASTPDLRAYAFMDVQAPPASCGGLSIPLPFVAPLCIDPIGFLTHSISGAATGAAAHIGAQIAPALIEQPDYATNDALMTAFSTVQGFARDLFGILFLAGILTWYVRRLGLGSPGDVGTQIVEAAFGLALVEFLPTLLSLSIGAANALSRAILSDPNHQARDAITRLIGALVTTGLISSVAGFPLLLIVLVGALVAFLVLLLLIIITRDIGIIYGAAVFIAAPLCVVCGITPLTRGVAFAWARLWISLTLWGVWYALAFVVVEAELSTFVQRGALDALVGALAGVLVIYGAPKLGDALIGGGAARALGIGHMPLLSTVIGAAVGSATGNALGGIAAAAQGGGGGGGAVTPAATPGMSVTEIGAASQLTDGGVIDGSWGLLDEAGV